MFQLSVIINIVLGVLIIYYGWGKIKKEVIKNKKEKKEITYYAEKILKEKNIHIFSKHYDEVENAYYFKIYKDKHFWFKETLYNWYLVEKRDNALNLIPIESKESVF